MRAQRGANAGLDPGGRGRVGIPPLLLGGRPGNGQRAGSLRPVHGEVRRADDRAHAAQEQTGTTRLPCIVVRPEQGCRVAFCDGFVELVLTFVPVTRGQQFSTTFLLFLLA